MCETLIKRIDTEGLAINHSTNSHIFEMATKIYKISALLGYLKTFDLKLDKFIKEKK